MNSVRQGILLVLLVAISAGNGEVQAQQASSIADQVRAEMEECNRKYPDPIKQAIANATCQNQALEALKRASIYPDLINMEMANTLMLAEKLQNGKMTLIEAKAAVARLHSEVVAESQRRQLAAKAAAAAARPPAPQYDHH